MRRNLGIILTLFALIVAACSPGPPDTFDWCYRFDFRVTNSMSVANGSWTSGVGYITDNNNLLSLSYDAGATVNPVSVIIGVTRVDSGDISISSAGNIFGINAAYSETMPGAFNNVQASIPASSAGISGTTANVSVQTSGTIALEYVDVYGVYANPFGASNCGGFEDTPTPAPGSATATPSPWPTSAPTATPEPTETPEPSETPENTLTPTPTGTWQCTWEKTFDFTVDEWDWEAALNNPAFGSLPQATWSSGQGWLHADRQTGAGPSYSRAAYIVLDISTSTVTYVSMTFSRTAGTMASVAWWLIHSDSTNLVSQSGTGESNSSITKTWSGSTTANQIYLMARSSNVAGSPSYSGSATITGATIRGTGTNPFTGHACEATNTPSPTRTITPTRTPSLTRTPRPGGNTFTPNPSSTGTITATASATRTNIPVFPPITIPPVYYTATSGTEGPTSTATSGDTPTPDLTATAGTGTPTLTPLPTSNVTPIPGEVGDVGALGGGIFATVNNLFNIGIGWIRDMSGALTRVTDAWYLAPATAPPGVPLCKTQPLAYEFCAILYILRWTMFSGTIGSLIMPLATIVFDLFIIFIFIRIARAILARLAKVTEI